MANRYAGEVEFTSSFQCYEEMSLGLHDCQFALTNSFIEQGPL